jgi:hypothetical protein
VDEFLYPAFSFCLEGFFLFTRVPCDEICSNNNVFLLVTR